MDLLMITSSWPNSAVTEFLEDEIRYLSKVFDHVVIAPMRPVSRLKQDLPKNVDVDYSLAEHLVRLRFPSTMASRKFTAVIRAVVPGKCARGTFASDLWTEGLNFKYLSQVLLGRADMASVRGWALSRQPPSLAYTFWLGPATVGLRKAWPSLPIVSRVHGSDLFSEAHGWQTIPFQSQALHSATLVASVSEAGREYLVRKHPDEAEKLVTRRLGIADRGIAPVNEAKGLRILSASSIDSNKRVLLLAQVALKMAQSHSDVSWTHLGTGPLEGEVKKFLSECAGSLKYSLPGQVSVDEVRHQMFTGFHDVFVNLSKSEGVPVSLMEAQSMGIPVVATNVGGSSEVAPAELNELIAPHASISDISDAIYRAVSRPVAERQTRRDLWNSNYNEEKNYTAWAEELSRTANT